MKCKLLLVIAMITVMPIVAQTKMYEKTFFCKQAPKSKEVWVCGLLEEQTNGQWKATYRSNDFQLSATRVAAVAWLGSKGCNIQGLVTHHS
jgi:hypothetical protein